MTHGSVGAGAPVGGVSGEGGNLPYGDLFTDVNGGGVGHGIGEVNSVKHKGVGHGMPNGRPGGADERMGNGHVHPHLHLYPPRWQRDLARGCWVYERLFEDVSIKLIFKDVGGRPRVDVPLGVVHSQGVSMTRQYDWRETEF